MASQPPAARRPAILAAAVDLLAERGSLETVTLDEIVARAGTTKATFYRHFPSKAALLAELDPPGQTAATEGRRDQLLDAARQVVRHHGLAGATMERIAAQAGVSPAALYWHFQNKDALLLALVRRATARLALPELLAGAAEADPAAVLSALAPRGMALQTENVELLGAVLAEVLSRPDLADELYDQVVVPIWGPLSDYLRRSADQGRLRPGHPLLRVVALVGMLTFYNLVRRAFGQRLDLPLPDEAADEIAQILTRGVLPMPKRGSE